MDASLVHYVVHPERVSDHICAVKKLFESLQRDRVRGIDYAIYLLGENVFIHVMRYRNDGSIDKLNERADIRDFLEGVQGRIKEEPIPIYVRSIAVLSDISINTEDTIL